MKDACLISTVACRRSLCVRGVREGSCLSSPSHPIRGTARVWRPRFPSPGPSFLHRLVRPFLGARLCLGAAVNKTDEPSSERGCHSRGRDALAWGRRETIAVPRTSSARGRVVESGGPELAAQPSPGGLWDSKKAHFISRALLPCSVRSIHHSSTH